MVRHIVMWNFNANINTTDKKDYALKIKNDLEAIKIEGIRELNVHINLLDTSNADIMLDSNFDDVEALKMYQENPLHKKAGEFIKSVTINRHCVDYEF